METVLGLCMGVALAAACGLRVFLPLLATAIAAKAGIVPLSHNFEWMASWPALVGFSVASSLEAGGSLWPWLDHALDVVASPCAIVAGAVLATAQMHDVHPALAWTAGIVAGGGAAGMTQAASVSTRSVSTLTTGGVLNPLLNAGQTVLAGILSILAVVVPVAAAALLLFALTTAVLAWRLGRRKRPTECDVLPTPA